MRERIAGRVPMLLESSIGEVTTRNGSVYMRLQGRDSSVREHETEHVIAATGYRVDLQRLPFLSRQITSEVETDEASPVLSRNFQSSVPGLYFTGLAAAHSFGPVLRFMFGADFAARQIARHLKGPLRRKALQAGTPPRAAASAG